MKKILTLMFALTLMICTVGCGSVKNGSENINSDSVQTVSQSKLTIEKIIELSKKGKDLSWYDFEAYDYEDVGSGLYIYSYNVEEKYHLLIGGLSTSVSPIYIRLVSKTDENDYVDVQNGDIEEFIKKHKS